MKTIKCFLVLAFVSLPAIASAQPGYYGGPPPEEGGFHHRAGRLMFGGSVGLGFMHDDGSGITNCGNCNYNPASLELDGHIGGMLNSRLAIMFEGQINVQTVSADAGFNDTTLTQSVAMVALQYWLVPQIWIKGGLGFAHLDAQDNYGPVADFGGGGAIMGAVGFELLSGRFFALDLQGRLISGSYHGIDDHVTAGSIGLGLNWY